MKSTLRKHVGAALMLLVPLGSTLLTLPASAQHSYRTQQYRVAQAEAGTVHSMSLNSNAGLRPGATLRVQVYATPDARWMNASLGGSDARVRLHERSPGEYVGTHVIARGERIDPTSVITVRGGWGEGPVAVAFNYPPSFQALAMGAGPAAVGPAAVTSFVMSPAGDLEPGSVVRFRLEGTPRARAWVNIPDVVRQLPLREVRPGVYVGRYTVRHADDPDAFEDARAVLRRGDQRVIARLNTGDEHYGYGYGR